MKGWFLGFCLSLLSVSWLCATQKAQNALVIAPEVKEKLSKRKRFAQECGLKKVVLQAPSVTYYPPNNGTPLFLSGDERALKLVEPQKNQVPDNKSEAKKKERHVAVWDAEALLTKVNEMLESKRCEEKTQLGSFRRDLYNFVAYYKAYVAININVGQLKHQPALADFLLCRTRRNEVLDKRVKALIGLIQESEKLFKLAKIDIEREMRLLCQTVDLKSDAAEKLTLIRDELTQVEVRLSALLKSIARQVNAEFSWQEFFHYRVRLLQAYRSLLQPERYNVLCDQTFLTPGSVPSELPLPYMSGAVNQRLLELINRLKNIDNKDGRISRLLEIIDRFNAECVEWLSEDSSYCNTLVPLFDQETNLGVIWEELQKSRMLNPSIVPQNLKLICDQIIESEKRCQQALAGLENEKKTFTVRDLNEKFLTIGCVGTGNLGFMMNKSTDYGIKVAELSNQLASHPLSAKLELKTYPGSLRF